MTIKAGELMNIHVHDHIIVGLPDARRGRDYASLKELGLM